MHRDWGRGVGALVVLGGIWILVYWWWEPSKGRIVFDDGPGAKEPPASAAEAPAPVAQAANIPAHSLRLADAARTGSPAPLPPQPRIAVVPPSFRTYTVKKGDTWELIAAHEMGSRDLWPDLTRANPLMTDLKPGRQIRIPVDPSNIQGRPVAEAPAGSPGAPMVEYTVKSGDTLGAIAKAYYGSITYKDLIFTANKDTLEREDQLKIGQKLKLPPKPN
jgi:nucleoid-associated protein YgaU